jgi:TonB-linked SusC/RagA family outer membrane protein
MKLFLNGKGFLLKKPHKLVLIMIKISFILLFAIPIQAMVYAQDDINLNIMMKNVTIRDVLKVVEKQSGYRFFFSDDFTDIYKQVSVDIQTGDISELLSGIFQNSTITYKMLGNNMVVITPSEIFQQQGITITGTVTDKNDPIPGVNVVVKGTFNGVVTDMNGKYVITVPDNKAVLVFSFIGYATQEYEVGDQRTINVLLNEDTHGIEEVVVIGYGTVRKSDHTGSLSSVSGNTIKDRVVTSVEDALKGKAAGVLITQNDGTPGSEFTLKIRGATSVNASSDPLYVVDGVYAYAEDVSPGDIASIEILKDASATAIYGSKGANGVVLITTKKGAQGKTRVDFNALVGVQSSTRPYDLLDAAGYLKMRYRAGWTYSKTQPAATVGRLIFKDTSLDDPSGGYWSLPEVGFDNYMSDNFTYQNNTDWQDLLYQTATTQDYRLTVSAGSEKNKISVMANYYNQEGIVVFSDYERFSGRVNLEQDLSSKVKLSTNLSVSRTSLDGVPTGTNDGITTNMLRQSPNISPHEGDFDMEDLADSDATTINPYYNAKHITKDRFRHVLSTRLVLDWNITKHLLFKTTGTYNYRNAENNTFYPKSVTQGTNYKGRAIVAMNDETSLLNENFLYYDQKLGEKHQLDVMGGAIFEQNKVKSKQIINDNFQVETLGANALGQGTSPQIPISATTIWRMTSFLSRINYNFDRKYLLTTTFRADGSSRFGDNNKWGFFPSVAVAWRASEEKFVKQWNIFSDLKLRTSVGMSGNTSISSYQTLSAMTTAFVPMDGTTLYYGMKTSRPENKSLKWEITTQYDAGIDLGFWDNRLTMVFDVYLKRTNDLLLQKDVMRYTGYEKTWSNIGEIQNKGMELTLIADILNRKDFSWSVNFNIGFNRSKVIDIGGNGVWLSDPVGLAGMGNMLAFVNGGPIAQWYGYRTNGIWKSQKEIDDSSIISQNGVAKANLTPGMIKVMDTNDDDVVDDNDKVCLGNGDPKYAGGFGSNFSYKGIEVMMAFQYSYGAKVFNMNRVTIDQGNNYNGLAYLNDCWVPSLYSLTDGTLVVAGNSDSSLRFPGRASQNIMLDTHIEDGSFLRFSDLTIGYVFPQKWTNSIKMERIKVFFSAKNLYMWSKYIGYDPEVNTKDQASGNLMNGFDLAAYPRARTFSFGLNFVF